MAKTKKKDILLNPISKNNPILVQMLVFVLHWR